MLLPLERLVGTSVMSLQTGAELAKVKRILIDPRDLTVAAYELEGHMLDQHPSFLRPVDVRELSHLGFIVDSSDEFVGEADVIRIQEVNSFNFDLITLEVIDEKNRKLGKVTSYAIDSGSFSIQQLSVKRPLLKSFNESELLINRTQIIEVSDTVVKVASADTSESAKTSLREYANPFRSTNVQPETIEFESRWHSSNQTD
jgi:sporulation protein YlmC with PRC-barrel domain